MIISLNIFTQLESMPIELLKRKSVADEERFVRFRKKVQQNHITFLEKHESVLITDLSEVVTESSGKVTEINSVLTGLPGGKLKDEWTWYFDLRNSDYYRKKSVFKVAAILI
jgi:hypothetical protein